MSFFVAERTHELGLRMALGASWPSVHKLELAAIGVVLGSVGDFATTKLTEGMVYYCRLFGQVGWIRFWRRGKTRTCFLLRRCRPSLPDEEERAAVVLPF